MTEKEFMNEVIQRLLALEETKGMNIQCQTFTKNNNTKRYAIVLQQEESMVSPAIYMERYYEEYQKKHITMDMAAECIADVIEKVRTQAREYHALSLDFEDCREHIIYRLISREMNEELVECVPNIPFLDLMITFYVVIRRSQKGIDIFQITNALMKEWEVSTAELFRLAERNTPQLFPARVEPMVDILEQYLGIQADEIRELPMTIMGNEAGVYGASVLLYPHLVEQVAEELGSSFYALPSSVNEFVIISAKNGKRLKQFSRLVQNINHDCVNREEILSNRAYFYDKEEKKFYL